MTVSYTKPVINKRLFEIFSYEETSFTGALLAVFFVGFCDLVGLTTGEDGGGCLGGKLLGLGTTEEGLTVLKSSV
jgi:hypothetical protein